MKNNNLFLALKAENRKKKKKFKSTWGICVSEEYKIFVDYSALCVYKTELDWTV